MKSALLTLAFLTSISAHALPLLAENAAQNTSAPLTLYPDSQDPNLFYYMPNSSGMAKERGTGLPMFGFTYWGLTNGGPLSDAGAYLVYSMRLMSDDSQRAALDAAIKDGKRVAVLPLVSSTINLTNFSKPGTSPLSALFSEFDFAQHAGMAEDEVGVNAILTGIGAKVIKKAIESPAVLKLDYCYKVEGLGPDFDASIHMNWLHVYDDFQVHASMGGWFTRVQIDAEIEKARQNGDIKVVINGGTAKDEEYIRALSEKMAEKLFVNDLSNTPTSSKDMGNWSFSNYQLKATHREELKTEDFSMVRRQLTTREFCVPMMLSDIRANVDALVHNAD